MINKNKTIQLSTVGRGNKIKRPQQDPSQSINHVYSLLNRQQETIDNLLNKYKESESSHINTLQRSVKFQTNLNQDGFFQNYIKPRSESIQAGGMSNSQLKLKLILSREQREAAKPRRRQNSIDSSHKFEKQYYTYREKEQSSRQNQSISLPIIHNLTKNEKSTKQKNSYSYHFKKQRQKMQHQLYKIYGEKNEFFANSPTWLVKSSLAVSRSKQKKAKKKQKSSKKNQEIQNEIIVKQTENKQLTNENNPNFYQYQSSDQSEEQVSLVYYQRQFRDMMKVQCTQELNFLYFSRNEHMKDWTDNLLSMIEKHDKEITGIRKKSRYLQNFDDKFFSIGIFNRNDL